MIVFELFHTLQAMKAGREHERLNTSPLINWGYAFVMVSLAKPDLARKAKLMSGFSFAS